MNFLLTLIYMYCMLTFVYPILANTLSFNNQIGFFVFVLVSFLGINIISNFYNKKPFDLSDVVDKNLYNTLVVVSTSMVIDDVMEINFINSFARYLVDLTKNNFTKNLVILLPLLKLHILRSLLKPY